MPRIATIESRRSSTSESVRLTRAPGCGRAGAMARRRNAQTVFRPLNGLARGVGNSDAVRAVPGFMGYSVLKTLIELGKNIVDISSAFNAVLSLRPVLYNWNGETDGDSEHGGFIAQEVESTLAQFGYQDSGMLNKDDNGYYSLRYNDFFAPIVRAIQELATTAKNNTTEINTLRSENESLKKRLDAIEARLAK